MQVLLINRDFDELPTPLRSIVKTYQLEYDLLDELKIYQKFAIARMNILRKNIQRFETALGCLDSTKLIRPIV